jgi:hypothetical protein
MEAYSVPLLSGLEVSFKKPVYLMVTVSPTLGTGPLPAEIVVFVTPMVALVVEKVRDVVVVENVAVESRCGSCENCLWKMENMYAKWREDRWRVRVFIYGSQWHNRGGCVMVKVESGAPQTN